MARIERFRFSWLLLGGMFMLGASGCMREEPPTVLDRTVALERLLQADRDFAVETGSRGSEGWASFFEEEGAVVRAGVGEIRGRDAVRRSVSYLDDPTFSLSWDPARAELSEDGTMGFTTGPYETHFLDDEGKESAGRGVYVSVWRLQSDGTWKIMMDLGNPGPDVDDGS